MQDLESDDSNANAIRGSSLPDTTTECVHGERIINYYVTLTFNSDKCITFDDRFLSHSYI